MVLLARCAGVHVDFHADRHFDDLRCFPGHFLLPSKSWREPRAARQARAGVSRAQAGVVRTRLRCWTCRNGRRLADVRPALKRQGNSDTDLSGIFRLPGGDARIRRPDGSSRVLSKSEIATFFVMRGIQRQYPESARQNTRGMRLFEQTQQGPAGTRFQFLRIQRSVIVGIGGLETLLDDREVFVERQGAVMIRIRHL
ncbi:hypothetical protein ABIB82_000850 [Bradyrhizobium sp. i1.8.4]